MLFLPGWIERPWKSKSSFIWKWYYRSAILPLFIPRLTSSVTKELTSPAKDLKTQFATNINVLPVWLNLSSSLAPVSKRKGLWNSSQKNLGLNWFHYLLAVVVLRNLHFCNSKNVKSATWTKAGSKIKFNTCLLSIYSVTSVKRTNRALNLWHLHIWWEKKIWQLWITAKWYMYEGAWQRAGAWEVLVSFPFSCPQKCERMTWGNQSSQKHLVQHTLLFLILITLKPLGQGTGLVHDYC